MEIWKDIPGYQGAYQASSYGRIRTAEGKVTHSVRHGIRKWKSRILKTRGINPQTGHRVTLWKNKSSKDYLVARLVCVTFHGPPGFKETVNHIDGNRFNNKIENLEWVSLKENIQHAFETGLMDSSLKPVYLDDIRFNSMSEASRWIGRNSGYISNSLKNNRDTVFSVDGKKYKVTS